MTAVVPLVPVRLESGVVVLHTREEWARYTHGVDMEAARLMDAPIELEEDPDA